VNSFSSMLRFVEDVFGLPSTGGIDATANDLFEAFNFSQTPLSPLVLPTRSKCPGHGPTPTPTPTPTTLPTPIPTSTPIIPYTGLSPSNGSYKQTVSATGNGYGASEQVNLYWDSTSSTPIATTTSTSTGSFAATFRVPASIGGSHTVSAIGQTSGTTTSAPFHVIPKLVLQTAAGPQGSSVGITGYGFAAGDSVTLSWDTTGGTPLGTAKTNQSGSLPATAVTIPVAPYGPHIVYAVGASGATASSTFRVAPTLSIQPGSGAQGSEATISGTGFGANESILLLLGNTNIAFALADATGTFSGVIITIPASATPGTVTIHGTGEATGINAYVHYIVTS
jgi:hypothetical protein